MKICVVGTGTMASGITQTFAVNGFEVIERGRRESSIETSKAGIIKNLEKLVSKGKMTEEAKDKALANITYTMEFADCKEADLFIEVVAEDMATKHAIIADIEAVAKESAVIATNTSSLSVTEIAAGTQNPARVIGMHFFNPVPMMKLVEIIRGEMTSDDAHNLVYKLSEEIGKTPVTVNEAPGFVVNRILIQMINEGIGIFAEGVASKEEIDSAMKLGANHPMGPLELGDLIGLDVVLAIMDVLYTEFGDPKYRAHTLLRKMVRAGKLGRKTKQGFYDYR